MVSNLNIVKIMVIIFNIVRKTFQIQDQFVRYRPLHQLVVVIQLVKLFEDCVVRELIKIIGWLMILVESVMIVKQHLRCFEESITVVFVVIIKFYVFMNILYFINTRIILLIFLRKGKIFCSKCASNLIPGGI